MKIKLSFLLLLINFYANATFIKSIPNYEDGILIEDSQEKQSYLDAIKLQLKEKRIDICRTKNDYQKAWKIQELMNNSFDTKTSLFLYDESQPLFVLRLNIEVDFEPKVVDFHIYTDDSATFVKNVYSLEYTESSRVVNYGNLLKPDIRTEKGFKQSLKACE